MSSVKIHIEGNMAQKVPNPHKHKILTKMSMHVANLQKKKGRKQQWENTHAR